MGIFNESDQFLWDESVLADIDAQPILSRENPDSPIFMNGHNFLTHNFFVDVDQLSNHDVNKFVRISDHRWYN